MNQLTKFKSKEIINSIEEKFNLIADGDNQVKFQQEAFFALSALTANDYLGRIAEQNPNSLRAAVLNVATINLSLNPSLRESYLIPRKGSICLDISYIGLAKLATDSGSIKWIQAEIVKEKDAFIYNGICTQPKHEVDSFGERGKIVGVYCIAKTCDGDFLVSTMTIEECHAIRDRSEAWKRNRSGPWLSDESEMIKKTIVKRSSKLLPKTERLQEAVGIINSHEGINFDEEKDRRENVPVIDYVEQQELIEKITFAIDRATEKMELAEKGKFIIDKTACKSIGHLKNKKNEELKEILKSIENYISGIITNSEVSWDGDNG